MRIEQYIFLKKTKIATANSGRNQAKKESNANQEEHLRKEAQTSRVRRYHEYSPLNMFLANLYGEVGQVQRFAKPKALKTRANTNRSLFCKYHNGFGHKIEDCYDLQNVVE